MQLNKESKLSIYEATVHVKGEQQTNYYHICYGSIRVVWSSDVNGHGYMIGECASRKNINNFCKSYIRAEKVVNTYARIRNKCRNMRDGCCTERKKPYHYLFSFISVQTLDTALTGCSVSFYSERANHFIQLISFIWYKHCYMCVSDLLRCCLWRVNKLLKNMSPNKCVCASLWRVTKLVTYSVKHQLSLLVT